MRWFRRWRGEALTQRYHPRCAACGHDTGDRGYHPFIQRWDGALLCLVISCPMCLYQWRRPAEEEERVTLHLNELEERIDHE
jgi:hypothetical protein